MISKDANSCKSGEKETKTEKYKITRAARMNTTDVSTKWTATQKSDSKRAIAPPTSNAYTDWTVDQLKLECTARKLSVAKNTKKGDRVAILTAYDESKGGVQLLLEYQRLGKHSEAASAEKEPRRTQHCAFRLINVLFSDSCFARFMSSGDQLTHSQLSEGGNRLWAVVADAFNTSNESYDSLVSEDGLFDGIQPNQITVHSATKLRTMWKD